MDFRVPSVRFAIVALGAVFLASLATAQFPSATFDAVLQAPSDPLMVGVPANVTLEVTRQCPNPVEVLPEGDITFTVEAPSYLQVAGPASVSIAQQVCATTPSLQVEAAFRMTAGPEAPRGEPILGYFAVSGPGDPLAPAPTETMAQFTVGVLPDPTAAPMEDAEDDSQDASGIGFAVIVGLLAGLATRRR